MTQRVTVRPHLAHWRVWMNGQHVATITHRMHRRYPYVLTRATAPRITLAHCPTWHAAKQTAREYFTRY